MNNLFISLILFSLCIRNTIGISKIVLTNELHNKILAVRCKSKDNNLGDHYLRVGQSKAFEFDDNVWRRTLFFCHMWKGPNYKVHKVFDAYRSKWKSDYGPTYFWIGREDGIYYRQDPNGKPPVKRYDWNLTAP
ncbi:hypothetical protein EUTSA_v10015919mg [Eutrema salsugineum]|uniref:S-protein homolog n=1 Tax=Eutrema salsugineum TaxID=72664 RepID=V4KQY6_EUTSA|nr:S-protein homolog 21 [Eutrema salsugineum]ESQ40345.1 hypothetical protein EUTSA_v10015919mg [Eutrema salsugineum]